MLPELEKIILKHWGYASFRPLQEEAMRAVIEKRDSVVVMPTGGGKSLCYQAPAMLGTGGTTVVVSPLISLMKDQVDQLKACGVPAVQIDSTLSLAERSAYEMDLVQGALRLLFVSPERLANGDFCRLLQQANVHSFAIDEAHCISHWGHDFRPEYRQMGKIKEIFPHASLHAYTATATESVRKDICKQLNMTDPLVLVGNFDRPNLTYRILPRLEEVRQIMEVLDRHKGEAGIVYCIRRADVDELNAVLAAQGIRSMPYHAGMENDERARAQEAFATEKCDVIVATVAFGMGINRSNLRFVIHAGMPKSIEHYQQETGRAGRDGLEAECVLLHSGQDHRTWKWILEKSCEGADVDPGYLPNALKHLDDMDRYCRNAQCRHRSLVQYFGQRYEPASCAACDICLGDCEPVPDGVVLAQKILSCVARVDQRFGVNHVVSVLRGENTEKIRSMGHDKLTTYGLLREHSQADLRSSIHQLVGQGVLVREGDEYPILKLNNESWEVMKKQRAVRLLQPVQHKEGERARKSRADTESWEGVDKDLFERLRDLRRDLAAQEGVPPYIIHSDSTLRELARVRPSSLEKMKLIYGIGEAKLAKNGAAFLRVITHFCQTNNLNRDEDRGRGRYSDPGEASATTPSQLRRGRSTDPGHDLLAKPTGAKGLAFDLFEQNYHPVDVAHQIERSISTVWEYLAEYVRWKGPDNLDQWLPREIYDRVAAVARVVGTQRLKPIFEELKGTVPYEQIRLVVAHLTRGDDL